MSVRLLVFGLGSNLGDRRLLLRRGAALLEQRLGLKKVRRSRIYQTPAAGGPPQPDFLNAAVAGLCGHELVQIWPHIEAIEQLCGRRRPDPQRWGPRSLDIDVLWSPDAVANGVIELPHPRLTQRPFALQPLLDVAPDACAPRSGQAYAALPAARATIEVLAPLEPPAANR